MSSSKRLKEKTEFNLNTGGTFLTPLRYPGGKGRLGPWFAKLMQHNSIAGGWYVEPYAGGAGAALYLLINGHARHIVINDADPLIYAFWKSVTEHPQELQRIIKNVPVNIDTWELQKSIAATPNKHDILEVGFAAFFLNRTNRSGILSAGVIGGKAQTGPWKLDARYNKDSLCARIQRLSYFSKNITVLSMDALDLLTYAAPGLPKDTLVYLDPPYYAKGSLLYKNHYLPEDHATIAQCASEANYPLVITYDDCPAVRALYSDFSSSTFSLHYSTHSARTKTNEALFYRNLDIPFVPHMTRGSKFVSETAC